MRIRLPYTNLPDMHGGTYQSVYCNVRLGLPHNDLVTEILPALIDSGASLCVFNSVLAEELGLELRAGRLENTIGIGGTREVWIHIVRLLVPGGAIVVEAGFQEDLPVFGLLGMEGFFEHFIVTFDALARECQLDRIYRA